MIKYLAGYMSTLVVLLAIDLIWLGIVAKSVYSRGIGHLMAEQPNLMAATVFYLAYAFGLMYFAVAPPSGARLWKNALLAAAVFGFVAYCTYDLSNLATLKNWPMNIAVIDILWGTVLSTVAAATGKIVFDWMPSH